MSKPRTRPMQRSATAPTTGCASTPTKPDKEQPGGPHLASMAEHGASLVLRDNYLQGEALSVAEAQGAVALDRQVRLIRDLERSGRLNRTLEFLPDDETLAARTAQSTGLVRPELAVLLAYAKMALDEELLVSELPDDPEFAEELISYFPAALRD